MAELISGVTGAEGIAAAVVNGAGAVYLSFDYEKAGYRNTEIEIKKAVDYCRAREVKLYVSIEHFPSDDDFGAAVEYARLSWRLGADAVVLSDIGLAKAVREAAPGLPIQAGPRMGIFTLSGVKFAELMGFTRMYLPKELTREEIELITKNTKLETVVAVQGEMCSSVDGQCMMSTFLSRKDEARGRCIKACRFQYSTVGNRTDYPLAMKDICLIRHLAELEEMGVAGFLLRSVDRRPEYTAMVTNVYYDYIENTETSSVYDSTSALLKAYTGREMTDLYYTGQKGEAMIGGPDVDQSENINYVVARKDYKSREFSRVPVHFVVVIKKDEPVKLAVRDNLGHIVSLEGSVPKDYGNIEIRRGTVLTQCRMTGATPYYCAGVRTVIDKGLFFSGQEMGELVLKSLELLSEKRREFSERNVYAHTVPTGTVNIDRRPDVTVFVLKLNQLSEELLRLGPKVLYIPVEEIKLGDVLLRKFASDKRVTVCAVLPKVIKEKEIDNIKRLLRDAKRIGINDVCVSNIGHIAIAKECGMRALGDLGLNIENSTALSIYGAMGLRSAVLAPNLTLEQVKNMAKPIPTELVVYGRLPMMYTENCIIKNSTGLCTCENFTRAVNSNGLAFPIAGGYGCRNTVYSSKKLFLGDKIDDYSVCGLWAGRLMFTTEHATECAKITARYMGEGKYGPTFYTRGLYYKGAE